jgi:hypothetical protein
LAEQATISLTKKNSLQGDSAWLKSTNMGVETKFEETK